MALFANRVVIGNRPGTTPITIDVSRQSQGVPIDMLESPTGWSFGSDANTICEKSYMFRLFLQKGEDVAVKIDGY